MANGHGETRRFAVLIDADNARPAVIDRVLSHVAQQGLVQIRRAYGDWTSSRLTTWKSVLHTHAILPVQQFSYTAGKNATDMALVIDAMDLLHAGCVQGFCIVSSDSDFTRLATRLRESGMRVVGCGEAQTPLAFLAACDEFVRLTPSEKPEPADSVKPPPPAPAATKSDASTSVIRTATHDDLFTPRAARNGVPASDCPAPPGPSPLSNGLPRIGPTSSAATPQNGKNGQNGNGQAAKPKSSKEAPPSVANGSGTAHSAPMNGKTRSGKAKSDDSGADAVPRKWTTDELAGDEELTGLLLASVLSQADEDGWAELGSMAAFVRTHLPTFRPRNYGYSQFQALVLATGLFEVVDRSTAKNPNCRNKFVRPKDGSSDGAWRSPDRGQFWNQN